MADTANLASEQEIASKLDLLNQDYQCLRAKLETLSAEQLNLYLHEVKWLLKQLGKIIPDQEKPPPEMYRQSSKLVEQVDAMQEALILERARRQFSYLQSLFVVCDGNKDTTTIEE